MGRKLLYLCRKMEKDSTKSGWWVAIEQKEKGKNKKVRYLIPIFC